MGSFLVKGGAALYGRVRVSGSKNAALPIIFASLITDGVSRIHNLADIGDVRVAIKIIEAYGAKVTRLGDTTLIDTRELSYTEPPEREIAALRASTYLLSSSLIRFGRAKICNFGGCNFGPRPIDMHLLALISHGARVENNDLTASELNPSEIDFHIRSVGATVNAIIAAAGCPGESIIRGIAREPHIMTLISYLRSAGARIELLGDTLTVSGGGLKGGEITIEGDMIEAGTFLAASIMTGGRISVSGAVPEHLLSFLEPLSSCGVNINIDSSITAVGKPTAPLSLTAAPYPAFPTDLQPVVAPILSYSGGRLTDTVWKTRFGYLAELSRFNIASRRLANTAEIFPSDIIPAEATAPDLRGGAALLLAALAADGESIIHSAELVLRGYEHLTEKLSALGAELEYIPEM